MSNVIDERVVEMQFDNKRFEENVSTSLGTIDKLKKALKLDGASSGLDAIQKTAGSFSMDGISNACVYVGQKFSALEQLAIGALRNIGSQGVEFLSSKLKAVTIEPITQGWTKYGQKVESVQSIMNSTGKSIDEIDGYLGKLQWFSDETSYGFTDMTSALSQMLTTGGDIDHLIPLLEGVANATAFAGKGNAEFQRSIYNLAQSYGTGHLQLMDWKSLQQAGTASKELVQTLIRAGEELGTIKEGEVTVGEFADTLKKGWATTEVMEKAFGEFASMTEKAYEMIDSGEVETASEAYAILSKQYDNVAIKAAKSAQEATTFTQAIEATADAVSTGWLQTFELIFGNYVEAKQLWTDLANYLWDIFASGAERRNEILKWWKEFGGRDNLFDGIKAGWKAFTDLIAPVKEAFEEVFPTKTIGGMATMLSRLTRNFKNFMQNLSVGEETADRIRRTFKGLFSILKLGKIIFESLARVLGPIIQKIFGFSGSVLNATASIGDLITGFVESAEASDIFYKVFQGIADFITTIVEKIAGAIDFVITAFENFTGIDLHIPTMDELTALWETLQGFWASLEPVGQAIIGVFTDIKDALAPIGTKIQTFVDSLKKSTDEVGETDTSHLEAVAGVFERIGAAITTVANAIKIAFNWIKQRVVQFAAAIKETFQSFDFGMFKDLVGSGGLIVIVAGIKKIFDSIIDVIKNFGKVGKKFVKSLQEITDGIGGVLESLSGYLDAGAWEKKAQTLKTLAIAVAILAGSAVALSFVKPEKLKSAVLAILVIIGALVGAFALLKVIMSKFTEAPKKRGLSDIIESISGYIDAKAMIQKGKAFKQMAIGILIIAGAVGLLALSMRTIGKLSWDEIKKGLLGVGALLAMLTIVAKILGNNKEEYKGFMKAAASMVIFGLAIQIMSKTIQKFAEMNPKSLMIGIAGLGLVLLEIATFTSILSQFGTKGVFSASVGMIAMAAAMLILSKSVESFSKMDPMAMVQGIAAVGAVLLEIATFTAIVSTFGSKGILSASIGMIAISAAMLIMTNAIQQLGGMDLESLVKGVGGVAVAILAVAAAVALMPPYAILSALAVVGIAAALLIMVKAIKSLNELSAEDLGKTLSALAKALLILAGCVTLMVLAIPGAMALAVITGSLLLLVPVLGLLAALPIAQIGKSILILTGALSVIGVASPLLLLAAIALAALGAAILVIGAGGLMAGKGLLALAAGISALALAGTAGTTAIVESIKTIIEGIGDAIVIILHKLAEGIVAFLQVISRSGAAFFQAATTIGLSILNALEQLIPKLVTVGLHIIVSLLVGINDNIGLITITAVQIIINFLTALGEMLPDIAKAGVILMGDFINAMAEGIRTYSEVIFSAVRNLMSAIIEFVIAAIQELVRGIPVVGKELEEQLEGVKGSIRETLAPESLEEIGEGVPEAVATGIESGTPKVEEASNTLGDISVTSVSDKLSQLPGIGQDATDGLVGNLLGGVPGVYNASSQMAEATSIPMDQVVYAFEHDGQLAGSSYNEGFMSNYSDLLNNSELWKDGALSGMTDVEAGAIGKDWGAEFSSNLKNGAGNAKEAGHAIAESALDGIRDSETDVTNRGNIVGDKYSEGINAKLGQAKQAGKSLGTNTVLGVDPVKADMYNVGNYAGKGFYDGLKSWENKIRQKAAAIARSVSKESKKALDERSPSKVMRQIGAYATEGLAIGLMQKASLVKDASSDVAGTAVNSMENAIAMVSDAVTGLDDLRPVIQPVFDLSELKAQAGYVNSMLGNQQVSFGARANISNLDQLMNLASQINQNGSSNADVVNAITDLRRDVNALGGQMERMQVRMDTGALVGALYNPLDKELGRQVRYRTRGA